MALLLGHIMNCNNDDPLLRGCSCCARCGEVLRVLAKAFPNSTFRGYDTSHYALE